MFYFADSPSKFDSYTENGWLYFFLSHLQPNDREAFIKYGQTTRPIIKRLNQYDTPIVSNIYAIKIPLEELSIREGAMTQIFKLCKITEDINIWEHYKLEYLKGDLNLMVRVYFYFCTCLLNEANEYKTKKRMIDPKDLLGWLRNLPTIEHYNITILSPPKVCKIKNEIHHISDAIESTKLSIEGLVITSPEESESETDKYICIKCGKECKDKRGLGIHNAKCEGIKSCQCHHCKQEFANPYSLYVHLTRCKISKKNKEIIVNEDVLNTQTKITDYEEEISRLHRIITDKENQYKNTNSVIHSLENIIKEKDNKLNNLTKELNDIKIENRVLQDICNKFIFKESLTNTN
jgi:hypothetical protein